MPRYAFIVKGQSPRDGGWVRLGGYFRTEELGWEFYEWFYPWLVLNGDFDAIIVKRTIVF